jgi:hypothetical protein
MENHSEKDGLSFENKTVGTVFYWPDTEHLRLVLWIKNNDDFKACTQICTEAEEIARPKYIYKVSSIHERGEDFVILDGIKFRSRVMSVNLSALNRAFPLIATSGNEIADCYAVGF